MNKPIQPSIDNVRAEANGLHETADIVISWEGDGYVHHFWLNDYQREVARIAQSGKDEPLDFIVYRNLPAGHENYRRSRTRHLDSTKGYCAKVLPNIVTQIPMLVAIARSVQKAKVEEQQRSQIEARKISKARELGPEMLTVLKSLSWLKPGDQMGTSDVTAIHAIIAKAEDY
ncbi:MAG: hypothetical protein ACYCZR_11850 [Burkholderiales bacterium]